LLRRWDWHCDSTGQHVETADIVNYGFERTFAGDILQGQFPGGIEGVVTNPPYNRAPDFIKASLAVVPFSAWLLRTNFVESTSRLSFFRAHPPARAWISSRRLPMMHRYGWTGPKAASNTAYEWFVWQQGSTTTTVGWFDWKEHFSEESLIGSTEGLAAA
jgi:hypothetical protein